MTHLTTYICIFFYNEIPSMPVPQLSKTLERYLASINPVISESQYERTRQVVEEFGKDKGVGDRLQQKLVDLSKTTENWATHFWLDDMYLNVRLPLPVNSSPFFLLPRQNIQSSIDQLRFAAKIILFALDYKKKIDSKELKPDVARGRGKTYNLCMKTYENFFTAYRRPGEEKDELITDMKQVTDNYMHIIVAYRNQFYALYLPAEDKPDEEDLTEKLKQITQFSKEREEIFPPVGILTTEDRTVWAKLRDKLLKRNTNCNSLKLLETCILVLCLDENLPDSTHYATIRKFSVTLESSFMASHILHGSGTKHGSCNRWYDKFLQAVVTKDGAVGFIVEHSASEGITVLRFCEEFLDKIKEEEEATNISSKPTSCPSLPKPVPLEWELDQEICVAIEEAKEKMDQLCKNVDFFVLRFDKYGKDFIKEQGISPDAFIQVALQLTYYKVHRRLVSTYESASLRRFKLGRVDNIRAATSEALKWVKAMCGDDKDATEENKVNLFKACIKKQTEILQYTISGEGPDNHLLALKEIAKSSGIAEPAFFQDKSYEVFLRFLLSTSQLPTDSGVLVGYGPVVPDGYGCSYNPCSNQIEFCISSFFDSKETSSDFFAHSLEGSLLIMREMCLKMHQLQELATNRTIPPKQSLRAD